MTPLELPDLSDLKAVVCDLDGTLYLENTPLPGARAFLHKVLSSGRKLFYFTNNTSRSRDTYLRKLEALQFPHDPEMLITATDCTIHYLVQHQLHPDIYLIGNRDLQADFTSAGFHCLSSQQCKEHIPKAVVLGFDTELDYGKIRTGYELIEQNIPYIATHGDILCPVSSKKFIPDVGSFIALFARATNGKEPLVMGKPSQFAVAAICARADVPPQQISFIGDRLYTDIRMAAQHGLYGILVLSGETTRDMLAGSPDQPRLVVPSVADLVPALESLK